MKTESFNAPLLFSIPEACTQLGGISRSYFYKLVGRGLIKLTKIGTRSFVSHDELLAVVAALGQDAEAKRSLTADDSYELRPSAA